MVKTRVHDLAAEFGVPPEQLLGILKDMNIFVRSHLSALESDQVSAIRVRWEREKRKSAEEPTAKKGRRKAVKAEPAPPPVEARPTKRRRTAAEVEQSGLVTDVAWIPAGEHPETGERFRFTIPTGHVMELYAEKIVVGNGMPNLNPDPWPDGLKGMQPSRFDHCLLYGDDLDGTVKLFTEVLGFGISEKVMTEDQSLMIGTFLSCSNKAHDVAFIRQPVKGKLHHASFLLDNWYEVLRAGDLIAKNDVSIDIGPTRHGITRGETIYFFDPSGNRNETFAGLGYLAQPDRPVTTWTEDQLGSGIFYHTGALVPSFTEVYT